MAEDIAALGSEPKCLPSTRFEVVLLHPEMNPAPVTPRRTVLPQALRSVSPARRSRGLREFFSCWEGPAHSRSQILRY